MSASHSHQKSGGLKYRNEGIVILEKIELLSKKILSQVMKKIKLFYLIAAIIGTILPWFPFFPFLIENNFYPNSILKALYINGATSGLSNDFFISCVVFAVFVISDAKSIKTKIWWMLIPAAPLIGLSMAFPAYLYIRSTQQHHNAN